MSNKILSHELNKIIENHVRENGLVTSPIDSMNEFYGGGFNLIITQFFEVNLSVKNTREDSPDIDTIKFHVSFDDVNLFRPMIDGTKTNMMPAYARKYDQNYSGRVEVDVTITMTAYRHKGEPIVKQKKVKNFHIASIPIMVRSNHCHTHMISREILKNIGEDPQDPGAHFILNGNEWIVAAKLSRVLNRPAIYHNVGHGNELARLEFISIPGDSFENSSEIKIRYLNDGRIEITFTSDKYLKEINLPFFVVFRLMQMTTEKDIINNIVYDTSKNTLSDHMRNVLEKAFRAKYDTFEAKTRFITNHEELRQYVVRVIAEVYMRGKTIHDKKEREIALKEETDIINENLMGNLDKNLFPHHGKAPQHRFTKARYLGMLMQKLLKVEQDIIPSTDRDSYIEKRVHDVGTSFSKMIKKEFNNVIVRPIMNGFRDAAQKTPIANISLQAVFEDSINAGRLQSKIERSLSTGMGTHIENGREVKNRVPSELLHRKNNLNVISSLQNARSEQNKMSHQDERSQRMRGVKTSQAGSLCAIESTATGVAIGRVPTFSIGASIASASSNEAMKKILLEYSDLIIPLNKVHPHQIAENNLDKVLVNGYWLGFTPNISLLFRTFKERRRGWDIKTLKRVESDDMNRKLSMHWEDDQIDFRVDRGRLISPLIVVRNNTNQDPIGQKIIGSKFNPKKFSTFEQRVAITRAEMDKIHSGELKMDDLVKMGCIDFIAPEELKKCLVAYDLEKLEKEKNNPLLQYTHVQIPITMIGLAAASSPFLYHNYPVRLTMQTGQGKQTCGLYANNFAYRYDTPGTVQFHNEQPKVETITTRLMAPNGQNAVIALMAIRGCNMEDSIGCNRAAAQLGAFKVWSMEFYKAELRKDEAFARPNEEDTEGIKGHANYKKLNKNGVVELGQYVEKNDVIIGRRSRMKQNRGGKIYRDTSLIYSGSESGWVTDIVRGIDASHKQFIKIKICSRRELQVGEKFSSRQGQKGMIGMTYSRADMPYTKSGITPTLLISPHAIPTRMTINQMVEMTCYKLSGITGISLDGTFGIKTDNLSYGDALEALGLNRYGIERMYDGVTGMPIQAGIYCSGNFYQRLQKFVEKSAYATGSRGPKTFDTRQPTEGKKNNGGARLGEMEKDTILAHGSSMFMLDKFRRDCDGFSIYVCRNCHKRANVNEKRGIYICRRCGTDFDPVEVPTRFGSHLYLSELQSMNVGIDFEPQRYEKFVYK